jgi:hypothetical protein
MLADVLLHGHSLVYSPRPRGLSTVMTALAGYLKERDEQQG